MSIDSIDMLFNAGRLRNWHDGERLCETGGQCNDIFVVISGAIELSRTNALGVRAVVVFVRPGEIINFIPAVDGRGAMHDQFAHGPTTVFHIPRHALLAQIASDPALLHGVFDLICVRSRFLYAQLNKIALSGFRARVADQLLTLANWYGRETAHGIELAIRVSQEDLASLLGASRQSVNKELRELVRQQVIDARYSRYTIVNIEALRAIARHDS
ncbi:hypothetical protein GQ57_39030 [Burkholderia sp. MSh2]|nr:hypothetical protein GQ57_39030 [Burkholderia sp. MSh2]